MQRDKQPQHGETTMINEWELLEKLTVIVKKIDVLEEMQQLNEQRKAKYEETLKMYWGIRLTV